MPFRTSISIAMLLIGSQSRNLKSLNPWLTLMKNSKWIKTLDFLK